MAKDTTKMNNMLLPLFTQASDVCREATNSLEQTTNLFSKLGMICYNIKKQYQSVADKFDFESLTKIEAVYTEMTTMLTSYSKILQEERESFFRNIESFFNFAIYETDGLERVSNAL